MNAETLFCAFVFFLFINERFQVDYFCNLSLTHCVCNKVCSMCCKHDMCNVHTLYLSNKIFQRNVCMKF